MTSRIVLRVGLLGLLLTLPLHVGAERGEGVPAKTIAHVLNRVGFGARPGDIEKIRAFGPGGIARYIDEQLHPERIPDSGIPPRIAALTTVTMSSREIAET